MRLTQTVSRYTIAVLCLARTALSLGDHPATASLSLSRVSANVESSPLSLSRVDTNVNISPLSLSRVDANVSFKDTALDAKALSKFQSIFDRSREVHAQSMADIASTLTLPKAIEALNHSTLGHTAELKEVLSFLDNAQDDQLAHQAQRNLRKRQSKENGLDSARKMLNGMIYGSSSKYDAEIEKCVGFYSKQCGIMEAARGALGASNYLAANARGLILDAQGQIATCEKEIPDAKEEIKQHKHKCKQEVGKLEERLKKVDGDISIMTMIMKSTDCDAQLVQTPNFSLLLCEDQCTKSSFMAFNQSVLQQEVSRLQLPESHTLLRDSFEDVFQEASASSAFVELEYSSFPWNGRVRMLNARPQSEAPTVPPARSVEIRVLPARQPAAKTIPVAPVVPAAIVPHVAISVEKAVSTQAADGALSDAAIAAEANEAAEEAEREADADEAADVSLFKKQAPKVNAKKKEKKVKMVRPPVPVTKLPANPCKDKNGGAPSAVHKRAAKCVMSKSPQCYKLQSKFLLIQSGIQDQSDMLKDEISKLERTCKDTEGTLQAKLQNIDSLLKDAQAKLADATQKESGAGENGRQISKEVDQHHDELQKEMKACNANYVGFESEMCALKKIRGEIYKKAGREVLFQDCQVSKWSAASCSKKCAGGQQKLTRSVMSQPQGGAQCLPLVAVRSCNEGPCPVDCALKKWTDWGKCSAQCGGGVAQRLRDIKVAPKFDGKPCSGTSQTKACNTHACEKDCELSKWTAWTRCSKDCDGGTMKRQRFIKTPAVGDGKCAGQWTKDRLQYKDCNVKSCKIANGRKSLTCGNKLDVMILIDGAPASGQTSFAAQLTAVDSLLDSFTKDVKVGVIQYSGPRTWSGVSKCAGRQGKKVNAEKDCKIKVVSHFTEDIKRLRQSVAGLSFSKGSKLLSLALISAKGELALGRADARSVVIAFIDGRPLSFLQTTLASRSIRKSARLLWVPLIKMQPLKEIKTWATRRWQENIVVVKSSKELASPTTVTHIVASICPQPPKKKL